GAARDNIYSPSAYVDSEKLKFEQDEDILEKLPKKIIQREDLELKYSSSKNRIRIKHEYHSKEELKTSADIPSRLVPIRLDLEIDGVKLRDAFTWNLNESLISPEEFAEMLSSDIDSSLATQFIPLIAKSIREQCATMGGAVFHSDDSQSVNAVSNLKITEDKIFFTPDDDQNCKDTNKESCWLREQNEALMQIQEECNDIRIVVKLDLNVGSLLLRDTFEWPLFGAHISPEEFAQKLTSDLGIGGEFAPTIAHSIREQVCLARLNFESAAPAPPLQNRPFRNEINVALNDQEWEPELRELTVSELEKIAKEKDRRNRRLRRSHRIRGTSIQFDHSPQTFQPYPTMSKVPYRNYVPTAEEQEIFSQIGFSSNNSSMAMPQAAPAALSDGYQSQRNICGISEYPSYYSNPGLTNETTTISPHLIHSPSPNIYSPNSNSLMYPSPLSATYPMIMPSNLRSSFPAYQTGQFSNQSRVQQSFNTKRALKPPPIDTALVQRQIGLMRRTQESCGVFISPVSTGNGNKSSEWVQSNRNYVSPPKKHRGFGASATPFNADGSVDVGGHLNLDKSGNADGVYCPVHSLQLFEKGHLDPRHCVMPAVFGTVNMEVCRKNDIMNTKENDV
ncbi:SWI SNF, matrix associated, actin dependent regulator of chromatin, sub b, member 1, partial [Nowakowskiella sp. JEL0078]